MNNYRITVINTDTNNLDTFNFKALTPQNVINSIDDYDFSEDILKSIFLLDENNIQIEDCTSTTQEYILNEFIDKENDIIESNKRIQQTINKYSVNRKINPKNTISHPNKNKKGSLFNKNNSIFKK